MLSITTIFYTALALWLIALILVLRSAFLGPTYAALAFRYFRRSRRFMMPPGSKLLLFELTPPAYFVSLAGMGSALTLLLLRLFAMPVFASMGGGLFWMMSVCLAVGAACGAICTLRLKAWGIREVDALCENENATVDALMVRFVGNLL